VFTSEGGTSVTSTELTQKDWRWLDQKNREEEVGRNEVTRRRPERSPDVE